MQAGRQLGRLAGIQALLLAQCYMNLSLFRSNFVYHLSCGTYDSAECEKRVEDFMCACEVLLIQKILISRNSDSNYIIYINSLMWKRKREAIYIYVHTYIGISVHSVHIHLTRWTR